MRSARLGIGFLLLWAPAALQAASFRTDFEGQDQRTVGTFTISDGGLSATFAGGTAFTIGNAALYRSGDVSWMIDPAGTSERGESSGEGLITLSADASRVAGYVRTENAQAVARLQGIDSGGGVAFETTANSGDWTGFDYSVPVGAAPIVELRYINDGGGMAALDDFAFDTPGTMEEEPPPYGSPGGGGGGGGGYGGGGALNGWLLLLLIVPTLLAGCGGNGSGLDENGRPIDEGGGDGGELQPTIESIQDHVFTPQCASCHAGALAPQGLRLEDAQTSYDNLVDVRSTQVPTQFRVEPGSPDTSYLIDTLEGTQAVGDRMPRGQPPLDAETIGVIRQWISDGAPPPGFNAKRDPFLLPPLELTPEPGSAP
ncbi:MAG: hypothetical protein ACLGI7_07095 [Gammaproteobacteria bacterium]